MTRRAAVLCAAMLGAAAALTAADSPPDAFSIAVLRRDGVLIPFAVFDGKRWRNAWPAPQTDPTVPINLSSVPPKWWGLRGPLDAWQAWVDDRQQPIRVTQPDWVSVHCARHIALRTDYRASGIVPPMEEQPFPKDGLAISPPHPVERIEILPTTAMEVEGMRADVRAAFNRAERQTASHTNHPIGRERELIDPQIEAVYAFGTSPRFYYVEANRVYRKLGQGPDECTAVGYGTGWFIREDGVLRSLVTYIDLLGCNRYGASFMLPLGIVRTADRVFWIAQFSGWEHERYAVIEITPGKVEAMISTWGGGC